MFYITSRDEDGTWYLEKIRNGSIFWTYDRITATKFPTHNKALKTAKRLISERIRRGYEPLFSVRVH